MKSSTRINTILFTAVFLLALVLRTYDLSLRPMHGDEAVNAVKLSEFLDTYEFDYDPQEYHGPAFYYFSLPLSLITGKTSLAEFDENTLRLLPALFGLGLVLLLLLFRSKKNDSIVLFAALCTAISPAFVFYSRYFIHEILLVFFCYAAILFLHRYWQKKSAGWLYLAMFTFGLMIGTKETWVILVSAGIISAGVTYLFQPKKASVFELIKSIPIKHELISLAILLLTIFLMYTSFLQNIEGFLKIPQSISPYLSRAADSHIHDHPWYMYLHWLVFFGNSPENFLGEGLILLLAFVGLFSVSAERV